ncbi:hypothetical protein BQ8482_30050 [Mesorhizobium delmotii]|uniref:Uncharacterized protein n=1 Tax=Mesorhizobium delmotii TaxID=1631247 RepID=A0A2P9AN81_9HYPH|nr:hypothetical protein BQ8482_30050 [Mesorhizobium delmotii]
MASQKAPSRWFRSWPVQPPTPVPEYRGGRASLPADRWVGIEKPSNNIACGSHLSRPVSNLKSTFQRASLVGIADVCNGVDSGGTANDRFGEAPRTAAHGAAAASRVVANNVCFQAVATVTSMADIRPHAEIVLTCSLESIGRRSVSAEGRL